MYTEKIWARTARTGLADRRLSGRIERWAGWLLLQRLDLRSQRPFGRISALIQSVPANKKCARIRAYFCNSLSFHGAAIHFPHLVCFAGTWSNGASRAQSVFGTGLRRGIFATELAPGPCKKTTRFLRCAAHSAHMAWSAKAPRSAVRSPRSLLDIASHTPHKSLATKSLRRMGVRQRRRCRRNAARLLPASAIFSLSLPVPKKEPKLCLSGYRLTLVFEESNATTRERWQPAQQPQTELREFRF